MVWVPGPIKFDTRTLFERLERINPSLNTTLWRLVIGVDEASAGTIDIPGKQGAEAETEVPGEPMKVMGEGVGEGVPKYNGNPFHTGKPPAQQSHYWGSGGTSLKREDAMPLPQLSTMDLAAAVLSFQERNMIRRIVICSSYLPYDAPDPLPNTELEDLVNFCKTRSWDLLVGCDSNLQHSVWGSLDVNPLGGIPLGISYAN
ncbi:hypothetical protein J437_LFUL011589 [Ladona fulva]|uniref:Uncharacterized protein n=1 Tax=Ladona fulva TaxID=123851 RepID=A0A8K0KRF5_LADFU|nr:hypothetical protein J437_LFUL011589 [Ladona fulva]